MTYRDIVKAQLKVDEGVKLKPYKDTVGKLTIGCGRNLDDIGISYTEVDYLLENDLNMAEVTAYPNGYLSHAVAVRLRALTLVYDELSAQGVAVAHTPSSLMN